ncbi:6-phosphogluconolactonase [Nocardioides ferulae]|uniref:6-phosphogluconolactonase n=1 Tax=Nocardioides ferulae TaxID=2340821 RepID=UPI000EAEF1B5|nr:6-phosphogluconolactonase [Nocardioides ferulae]
MSTLPAPIVEVHDDAADLASAAAGAFVARLVELQADGRTPHVALTGGSIAEAFHREVTRHSGAVDAPGDDRVDWSRVVFWWGDERFVAPDSTDRNAVDAHAAMLAPLGVPAAHVHEAPSTAAAGSVDEAAEQYAADLEAHLGGDFDLVLLGVGPDGHVASLFPGRPELDVTDRAAVGVTGSPKPPPERVTLTFPALNRARSVWFLVSGEGKAGAAARALAGGPSGSGTPSAPDLHQIPAAGVRGREQTLWFLDRAAATRL